MEDDKGSFNMETLHPSAMMINIFLSLCTITTASTKETPSPWEKNKCQILKPLEKHTMTLLGRLLCRRHHTATYAVLCKNNVALLSSNFPTILPSSTPEKMLLCLPTMLPTFMVHGLEYIVQVRPTPGRQKRLLCLEGGGGLKIQFMLATFPRRRRGRASWLSGGVSQSTKERM